MQYLLYMRFAWRCKNFLTSVPDCWLTVLVYWTMANPLFPVNCIFLYFFLYKSLFLKDLFIHIPAHERYNVRCKRIDMKEREFHMFYHLLTLLKSKLAFTESSVSQQPFYFNTVGMKRHPDACDSWHLALCIRKMTSSHGLVGPASLLPGPYGIHYFYHRKATRLLKT